MDGVGRGVLYSAIAGAAMGVSYFGLRLVTGSAKAAEVEERLERAESAARTRSPEPAIIPVERLAVHAPTLSYSALQDMNGCGTDRRWHHLSQLSLNHPQWPSFQNWWTLLQWVRK